MSATRWIVAGIVPLGVVAAIWFPVVEHYYVPRVRIPESSLAAFVDQPSDEALAELGKQFLGTRQNEPTGLPLDSPEERLRRDGLFDIAAELDRFEQTGNAGQFDEITASVLAYSRRTNGRFAYGDFLWNDHAVANRVLVLARFWRHYRGRESFEPSDARVILEHVAKNVQFLLRDDHFTAWSNHGLMQSIALLHAANAFPALPGRNLAVTVALDRVDRQLKFFVADSGWIMEHSAGYQEVGSNLLSTLLAELELLGEEPPQSWQNKTRESQRVLEWLTRPGGSIPNFGDSGAAVVDPEGVPATCEAMSPGARHWAEGYLIAWDIKKGDVSTRCAQTTVVWAGFISRAHKRPNELSVHYWVDGVDYAMSSGYWPYGDPERLEAIGWRGSNAPHYAGENGAADYSVAHRGYCVGSDFRFIDLERSGVGGSVRRQLVDLGVGGVLLVDSGDAPTNRERESVWRIGERLTLIGPDGKTVQVGSESGGVSNVIAVSGESVSVETLTQAYARGGHTSPSKFSAVDGRERIPAYAVKSAADHPSLISLGVREAGKAAGSPRLTRFESPESWTVQDAASGVAVERSGAEVKLTQGDGAPSQCSVAQDPDDRRIREMEQGFLALAGQHPVFRPWTLYRLKATMAALALFVAQLLVMALLSRVGAPTLRRFVEVAAIAGWLGFGAYITLVYLAQ